MILVSSLLNAYMDNTNKQFIWPFDLVLIYVLRIHRRLVQRSHNRYVCIKRSKSEPLPDEVRPALKGLLKTPRHIMSTNWKMMLANRHNRNFLFYGLIKATRGNVIELGRALGRTLAQGLLAFDKNDDSRLFVSVDPVGLDVLKDDFVSHGCRDKSPYVYKALDQKYLPDNYLSVLTSMRSRMKIVRGYSFEAEVLEYVSSYGLFDVILLDAYWAEDTNTYEAAKRDLLLYGPVVEKGGYILISNAFSVEFEIHKLIAEINDSVRGGNSEFIPIRIDKLGLFTDRNSCLLKKMT